MPAVCVSIGSNLGDRSANLRFAIEKIRKLADGRINVSSVYESEAWGYHSDNPFYNVAAIFESETDPESLLDRLQNIEREAGSGSHRDKEGNYTDRILDIDIIFCEDRIIERPDLSVPHPRMTLRNFVLVPLCEIMPGFIHPVTHKSIATLLRECPDTLPAVRLGE